MQNELGCTACNGMNTLGKELLCVSLDGETSQGRHQEQIQQQRAVKLLYHSTERRHPLLTWPPHQGLCGFRPPIIPHILLGSVAICFTWGLAPSAASPWLTGKGCSWGWAEGEGLSPTCSSSTWLSALVLCALSGNKSDCPQGKSWGDEVKGHETWQYYCSNGKSGIHC